MSGDRARLPAAGGKLSPSAVLFCAALVVTLVLPTFPSVTRIGGTSFGAMGLTGVSGALFLVLLLGAGKRQPALPASVAVTLLTTMAALTAVALLGDSARVVRGDLVELIRPVYLLVIFLAALSVRLASPRDERLVSRSLIAVFVLLIAWGALEVLGPDAFEATAARLYKPGRSILQNKATGFFGVTYFFSACMILAAGIFLFRYLVAVRRRALWGVLTLLALLAILLSQSRTGFLAIPFFMIGAWAIALSLPELPRRRKVALSVYVGGAIAGLAIAFTSLLMSDRFRYLYAGLSRLLERGVSLDAPGSENERLRQIVWAFENMEWWGLVGSGVAKGYGPLLESAYAYYPFRYGLVASAAYIAVVFVIFLSARRAARLALYNGHRALAAIFLGLAVFIFVLPVTSLSSVITDQPRLSALFYGLSGLVFAYLQQASVSRPAVRLEPRLAGTFRCRTSFTSAPSTTPPIPASA